VTIKETKTITESINVWRKYIYLITKKCDLVFLFFFLNLEVYLIKIVIHIKVVTKELTYLSNKEGH